MNVNSSLNSSLLSSGSTVLVGSGASSVSSNASSANSNLLTSSLSAASVVTSSTASEVFTQNTASNTHQSNSSALLATKLLGENTLSNKGDVDILQSASNSNSLTSSSLTNINSQMSNTYSQMSKDLIFNSDNKTRLCLMRTCISLIPRIMPLFKENELVDILTRLTIHIDDELKIIAFQTLKTFVSDYPQWRRFIFNGFTNFILKEISDMYPKLIENALKMLIQLLNTWKWSLNSIINKNKDGNQSTDGLVLLDDCCQIIYHLEGFSLFTLCHSHVQRRRYGLIILKECKQIGELVKCFRCFPNHNYTIDVLDLASIFAMKQLHLQCFNSSLIVNNLKPDLNYLIEQSVNWEASVNTGNFNSNTNQTANNANESVNDYFQIISEIYYNFDFIFVFF